MKTSGKTSIQTKPGQKYQTQNSGSGFTKSSTGSGSGQSVYAWYFIQMVLTKLILAINVFLSTARIV